MSHTPGPWKTVIANYSEDNISWLACADVITPRGATLVRFEGTQDYRKNNEHEANAQLIAAAPEMLEALEELLAELDESGSLDCLSDTTRDRVANLIIKARVRS